MKRNNRHRKMTISRLIRKKRTDLSQLPLGRGFRHCSLIWGVDKVVSGGQTMNPSTEDILSAIHTTPGGSGVCLCQTTKTIIMVRGAGGKAGG